MNVDCLGQPLEVGTCIAYTQRGVEINPIELLRIVGWARSNGEAKRMIEGGGLYIDNEKVTDIEPFWFAGSVFIMKHGRKWLRIILSDMQQWYPEDEPEEYWS